MQTTLRAGDFTVIRIYFPASLLHAMQMCIVLFSKEKKPKKLFIGKTKTPKVLLNVTTWSFAG